MRGRRQPMTEGRKIGTEKTAAIAREAYASGERIHHYKDKHRDQETCDKISAKLMGNIPWNKGLTLSPEECKKIGDRQRGKHVKLEKKLNVIGLTYLEFKTWVIEKHNQGMGKTCIWKMLPCDCGISISPIKIIIKEYENEK